LNFLGFGWFSACLGGFYTDVEMARRDAWPKLAIKKVTLTVTAGPLTKYLVFIGLLMLFSLIFGYSFHGYFDVIFIDL
jgi:hypothetical protein